MPSGREVLEVFEDGGIQAEAANDLRALARAVPRHSDRSRPSIGDEMLNSSRKSGSGNKDKIARRMTQPQVRNRSDVSSRLARIGPRLSDRCPIWQTSAVTEIAD